jgi:glutathione S-transferase
VAKIVLVVGDLSTWSLRAWLCMKLAEIEFNEIVIPIGKAGYREQLAQYSSTGLVPVLIDGDLTIHDSLAIAEYINEYSNGVLLPRDKGNRARARSLTAEIHSGFSAIRSLCSFTLEEVHNFDYKKELDPEVARLQALWSKANGPFYFGQQTGMVDAFNAVMARRLLSYDILLQGKAAEYQNALLSWNLFVDGMNAAKRWRGAAV